MKERTKVITILLAYIALAVLVSVLGSCNFTPAFAPDDFAWHPPKPVEIVVDTPCTDWVEITEPKFVTGYFIYNDIAFTDGYLIVGNDSAWIDASNYVEFADILRGMLAAWKPQFSYKVYQQDSPFLNIAIVAEGTNNRAEFQQYVRLYFNNIHAGFGWHSQGFTFLRAVSAAEYLQLVEDYPSVDYFTFIQTNYDSLEYIELALKILGECKLGRNTADFRYMPITMPDTIITLFQDAGWENILQ